MGSNGKNSLESGFPEIDPSEPMTILDPKLSGRVAEELAALRNQMRRALHEEPAEADEPTSPYPKSQWGPRASEGYAPPEPTPIPRGEPTPSPRGSFASHPRPEPSNPRLVEPELAPLETAPRPPEPAPLLPTDALVPIVEPARAERPLHQKLELADALGVAFSDEGTPTPMRARAPRARRNEASAEEIDVQRFLGKARASEPARSAPTKERRRPAPPAGRSASRIRRVAETSSSMAKILPMLVFGIVLICTGLVFTRLMGGGDGVTPHVRLQLLGLPGGPTPEPDAFVTTHVRIETVPEGVLVFFDDDILGKTPFEADVPYVLPNTLVGRLRGPRFQPWANELERNAAGELVIHAELVTR